MVFHGEHSMKDTNNRIRQARRQAKLSQRDLATRIGVHRSAVAQWEQPEGSHPTVENMARLAITTAVNFEWLATGRGRMKYSSDLIPGEETPAVLLEYSAQSETEVRALASMRKLDFRTLSAIVDMIDALALGHQLKLGRKTPYSR
jgi:transcriptional regulator with XRE-family HTH domain